MVSGKAINTDYLSTQIDVTNEITSLQRTFIQKIYQVFNSNLNCSHTSHYKEDEISLKKILIVLPNSNR